MHNFRKLIRIKHVLKEVFPIIYRNVHSTPKPNNKKPFFIILSVFGLTSYYYLHLVPKWLDKKTLTEKSSLEYDEVLNQENIDSNIRSKLCTNEESAKAQFNFIDKVVKKCAPGVFHIYITNTKTNTKQEIGSSPFVYGSGFVIREDGWALTNAHVVLNKDSFISCKMSDGTVYSAEIVDIDVNIDVALLKLDTDRELTALPLEEPGVVDVGEWVVALGSPLCLSNSISVGVVSSVNRSAKELGLKNYSMSYIQTDALITFGNSGGPLVNINGKVIGISSLRLTSGISFAIPVDFCLKFLRNCRTFNPTNHSDSSREDGEMTLFGLTTIPITSDVLIDLMQKKLLTFPKDVDEGLLVWKILEGSLAQEYGLSAGDVITHINGVPVKFAADIYKLKSQKKNVEFVIIKKATQEEISLTIPLNKDIN
ncbi:serine protease HTRA2, mitochondrial-like [Coccinella septempunctata]|uniref:serine protease HTRA2, mitochondrial-like n=1 Tax=Coccinella septempunctata TaxID=41139 RepID=UPI001D05E94A|nr:serine protease HTRA2, mitochondrial-like [Coccinella septempunctata]